MRLKPKLNEFISKKSNFRRIVKKINRKQSHRIARSKGRDPLLKSQKESFNLKLSKMSQGSTNLEQNEEPQASTSGTNSLPKTERDRKKSFKKIKDNKHREELIKKYKLKFSTRLKDGGAQNTLFNQSILKKVINQIKKRNKQKSPCKFIGTTKKNVNRKKDIEGEASSVNLDDDCICIENKTEVILIEDESTAPINEVKELEMKYLKFKHYEPIGKIRHLCNENLNSHMITSTPNTNRLSGGRTSRVPFHEDNSSTFSSIASSTACTSTEDLTIVEDVNNDPSEVIVINDDTIVPKPKMHNKRNRLRNDDSVVFVSEQPSSTPAFIPLDTPVEEIQKRITPASPNLPRKKRKRNELFTSKEEKQLKKYNNNAYNPNKDSEKETSEKRMVIVDGSNVAYQYSLNKEFSVKGLKICLDYFAKMGHEVKAVVPQHRMQKKRSSDPNELDNLHRQGKIVLTPCKNLPGRSTTSYDDRFILQLASELDAAVVSNDNYRDLINENSAFKKIIENRVIGYTWCNDIFILPKDPYGKWGPSLASILNRC